MSEHISYRHPEQQRAETELQDGAQLDFHKSQLEPVQKTREPLTQQAAYAQTVETSAEKTPELLEQQQIWALGVHVVQMRNEHLAQSNLEEAA